MSMAQVNLVKIQDDYDRDDVAPMLLAGLHDIAAQLNHVFEAVDEASYTHLVDTNGSIGKHVRHILDFMMAIAQADTGMINYDQRKRDTDLENNPNIAKRAMVEALADIERFLRLRDPSKPIISEPIMMCETLSTHLPAMPVETTLAREIAYVIQHSTHHIYIIKTLALAMNLDLGQHNIGVAPSTLAYQKHLQR